MKKVLLLSTILVVVAASVSYADEYVRGYVRKDGTYVAPYYRSDRDSSYNNNYSTSPNVNPYTNEQGTKAPTYNDRTPEYNQKTYGNTGTDNGYSGSGGRTRTRSGYGW